MSATQAFAFRLFLAVAAAQLAVAGLAWALLAGGAPVAGLLLLAPPALTLSLGRRHRTAVGRSLHDGLTDLGNQRAFESELARAVAVTERTGEEFALAVLDVDDFKLLNDRRGHQY